MNHRETKRVLERFPGVSGWFFSLRARAEPQTPAQGPRLGRWQAPGRVSCGQARRLTLHISQMEDPSFPLDDLFQWLIILTQTQDFNGFCFFFNDTPVNNIQKL